MDKIEAVKKILADNLKILGKHNENGLEVSYFGIDAVDVDELARQIVEPLKPEVDEALEKQHEEWVKRQEHYQDTPTPSKDLLPSVEEIRDDIETVLKASGIVSLPVDAEKTACHAVANDLAFKFIKPLLARCEQEIEQRVKPYLEDTVEILTNAQGEWSSVTKTYAPEWTHPLKEVIGLMEEALKGVKHG